MTCSHRRAKTELGSKDLATWLTGHHSRILMDKQGIPFLSVAELGEFIRTRHVSPMEATTAYFDRIDALISKFTPS